MKATYITKGVQTKGTRNNTEPETEPMNEGTGFQTRNIMNNKGRSRNKIHNKPNTTDKCKSKRKTPALWANE